MTPEDLRITLEEHRKWRRGEGGQRAVLTRAVLTGADLRGAVLTGAVLTGAVLTRAVLTGAVLTRAVLTGAVLTNADLTDADLTGADLRDAVLTGADLRDADLRDANLRDADLRDANLRDANLRDADLRDANLTGAVLTGAVLTGAVGITSWCATVKADLFAVLDTAAAEVPALLAALEQGRVDGSTYSGECACLVGTLGHARGVDPEGLPTRDIAEEGQLARDSSAPAEVWFMGIRQGDTPSTSPTCAITAVWVREWMAKRATAS